MMVSNQCLYRSNTLLMFEIRKKILKFRDILDLPPLGGASMIELLTDTVGKLQKFCPDFIPCGIYEMDNVSMYQGLSLLFEALKFACTTWDKKTEQSGKFQFEEVDLASITQEELGERILDVLDLAAEQATEFLDLMEQVEQDDTVTSQHQKRLGSSTYNRISFNSVAPLTPTSVLPEMMPQPLNLDELTKTPCNPPLLWPLRLQAVGHLKPIDMKRLSFHASTQVSIQNISPSQQIGHAAGDINLQSVSASNISHAPLVGVMLGPDNSSTGGKTLHETQPVNQDSEAMVRNIGYNHGEGGASADATLPLSTSKKTSKRLLGVPLLQSSKALLLQPLPLVKEVCPATIPPETPEKAEQAPYKNVSPPSPPPRPPPPPPPPTKASEQLPTPPTSSSRGPVPPSPPPFGIANALRAKKSTTKLRRSTHMGNLYRILKGKVEGSILHDRPSPRKRNQIGGGSGANKTQGMADALAEMTKRSSYFRQIEEDIEKHGPSIMELKSVLTSFQTSDMNELIKFHWHVELNLEKLTDETQVLSRFEGFPSKKLESIRLAASLYSRLEAIATNLQNWKIMAPVPPLLDKVESYLYKIKEEVDAIERNKEEESKLLQRHNINFDFNMLIRIKELMVDLSSSCIELVLKERRKELAATTCGESTSRSNGLTKMLWRAFQLAFRVYSFAGGQDDRADKLTKELAHEIETFSSELALSQCRRR